jgi:hypothetical protein
MKKLQRRRRGAWVAAAVEAEVEAWMKKLICQTLARPAFIRSSPAAQGHARQAVLCFMPSGKSFSRAHALASVPLVVDEHLQGMDELAINELRQGVEGMQVAHCQ